MNSYRTMFAAAHLAGFKRSDAVAAGQFFHEHGHMDVKRAHREAQPLPPGAYKARVTGDVGESLLVQVLRDLNNLVAVYPNSDLSDPVFDSIETTENEAVDPTLSTYSGPTSGASTWNPRHGPKPGTRAYRDQSEDRPAPKYLVQYVTGSYYPWQVVKAATREVVQSYKNADYATSHAVRLEAADRG